MQIKPHFRLERQPKQVIIQVVIHICLELIGCCDIDNNLVVVIIKKINVLFGTELYDLLINKIKAWKQTQNSVE